MLPRSPSFGARQVLEEAQCRALPDRLDRRVVQDAGRGSIFSVRHRPRRKARRRNWRGVRTRPISARAGSFREGAALRIPKTRGGICGPAGKLSGWCAGAAPGGAASAPARKFAQGPDVEKLQGGDGAGLLHFGPVQEQPVAVARHEPAGLVLARFEQASILVPWRNASRTKSSSPKYQWYPLQAEQPIECVIDDAVGVPVRTGESGEGLRKSTCSRNETALLRMADVEIAHPGQTVALEPRPPPARGSRHAGCKRRASRCASASRPTTRTRRDKPPDTHRRGTVPNRSRRGLRRA